LAFSISWLNQCIKKGLKRDSRIIQKEKKGMNMLLLTKEIALKRKNRRETASSQNQLSGETKSPENSWQSPTTSYDSVKHLLERSKTKAGTKIHWKKQMSQNMYRSNLNNGKGKYIDDSMERKKRGKK